MESFLFCGVMENKIGKWSDMSWLKLLCLTCHFFMVILEDVSVRSMADFFPSDGLFLVGVLVLISLKLEVLSILTNSCDFFVDFVLPHNG